MEIKKESDDKYRIIMSDNEVAALRRALFCFCTRNDTDEDGKNNQLFQIIGAIKPDTAELSGINDMTIERMLEALKSYKDQTKLFIGEVACALRGTSLEKKVNFDDVNTEVGFSRITGAIAGEMAESLEAEHILINNPLPNHVPAYWLK